MHRLATYKLGVARLGWEARRVGLGVSIFIYLQAAAIWLVAPKRRGGIEEIRILDENIIEAHLDSD